MKLELVCRHTEGKDEWVEKYEKDINPGNEIEWAENLIANFNATLRPHEKHRTLIRVDVVDENNDGLHKWEKSTGGMSACFRGKHCDIMFCQKCGITGKRYGLSGRVTIDSKYKKKAYARCDTAKKQRMIDEK